MKRVSHEERRLVELERRLAAHGTLMRECGQPIAEVGEEHYRKLLRSSIAGITKQTEKLADAQVKRWAKWKECPW